MRRTGRPSLSDYDVDNFDDYETMQSSSWDKGQGAYRVRVTHEIDGSDLIGSDDCWCGKPSGHDWKDKNKKAPHPNQKET